MVQRLTRKQEQFLNKWRELEQAYGRGPTYQEMMDAMGYSSPNSVTQNLTSLKQKGAIVQTDVGWAVVHVNQFCIFNIPADKYLTSNGMYSPSFDGAARLSWNDALSKCLDLNVASISHAIIPIPLT